MIIRCAGHTGRGPAHRSDAPDAEPPPDTRAGRKDQRMLQAEWRPESLRLAQAIKRHAEARPQRICPLKAIRAGLGSHWTAVPSIRAAGEAARLHMGTSLSLCGAARLGRRGQHAEAVTIEHRVLPRYDT